MPLKLTTSNDGVQRATLRVGFRVDPGHLQQAVLWHVEKVAGNLAEAYLCLSIVGALTRAEVLEAARAMFYARGTYLEDIGRDLADGTEEAALDRVRDLFPEFENDNQKGR
jgi:hypothetical protein